MPGHLDGTITRVKRGDLDMVAADDLVPGLGDALARTLSA